MPVPCLQRRQRCRSAFRSHAWRAPLLVAVFLSSCQQTSDGTAAELRDRLHAGNEQRFGFIYRAGGTAVLDCMLPNRQIHVTVDRDAETVELRRTGSTGSPLAVSRPDALLVHRSAFVQSSIPTEWISVPGEPGTPPPEDVVAALGVGAASYVLSSGLPADGTEMTASLIDSAAEITTLEAAPEDLADVDGYRIELRSEALADADTSLSGAAQNVMVDLWIDQEDVVRRLRVFEPSDDSGGWTLDFTNPARPLEIAPGEVTLVSDVLPVRPAPIPDCTLGRGSLHKHR